MGTNFVARILRASCVPDPAGRLSLSDRVGDCRAAASWRTGKRGLLQYWAGRCWYTSHFWSLSMEEHFYLFWPALLAGLGVRRALIAGTVLLTATALWRPWSLVHMSLPFPALQRTDMRLDAFLFAGALGILLHGPHGVPLLRVLTAGWFRFFGLVFAPCGPGRRRSGSGDGNLGRVRAVPRSACIGNRLAGLKCVSASRIRAPALDGQDLLRAVPVAAAISGSRVWGDHSRPRRPHFWRRHAELLPVRRALLHYGRELSRTAFRTRRSRGAADLLNPSGEYR